MTTTNCSTSRLKLASWNVRSIKKLNKLLVILDTLSSYNIDIALLQETKIGDAFSDKYNQYTLYFPADKDKRTFHGVAMAVKNSLKPLFYPKSVSSGVSDRIMHCILDTKIGKVHIINVYAPVRERKHKPENSAMETDEKESTNENYCETFYEHLEHIFSQILASDLVFLFGDFNAHVGPKGKSLSCLGKHCVYEKPNVNGIKLIDFCEKNNLCIVNTFWEVEKDKKMTHCNTPKGTSSELDLLITPLKDINLVKELKIFNNKSIQTDHCIVMSEIEINIPNVQSPPLKVNITKLLILLSKQHTEDSDLNLCWEKFKSKFQKVCNFNLSLEISIFETYNKQIYDAIKELKEANASLTYLPNQNNSLLVDLKTKDACSLILESLNSAGFALSENEILKEIDCALLSIALYRHERVFSQLEIPVHNHYWSNIEVLPSLKEQDDAMTIFEKSPKYKFLRQLVYSLITDIWKYGQVPIEMFYAHIFCTSEGQEGISIVNMIYNAVQLILRERCQAHYNKTMDRNVIYNCLSAYDMMTSLRIMQNKFEETKQPFYMAFFDWSELLSQINMKMLVKSLLKWGFPNKVLKLMSNFTEENNKFTVDQQQTNHIYLEQSFWNLFFSYILEAVFTNVKPIRLTRKVQPMPSIETLEDMKINALICDHKMVWMASSALELKQSLLKFAYVLNTIGLCIDSSQGMINIPMQILVPEVNEQNILLFSSLTDKSNIRDFIKFDKVLFISPILLEKYRENKTTKEVDEMLDRYFSIVIHHNTALPYLQRIGKELLTFDNYITFFYLENTNKLDDFEIDLYFRLTRFSLLGKRYFSNDPNMVKLFFGRLDGNGESGVNFIDLCHIDRPLLEQYWNSLYMLCIENQ